MSQGEGTSASRLAFRERNAPAKPRAKPGVFRRKDRATLMRQAAELETLLLKKNVVPEKVLVQEELLVTCAAKSRRTGGTSTSPTRVNPPFAFVHISLPGRERRASSSKNMTLEPSLEG